MTNRESTSAALRWGAATALLAGGAIHALAAGPHADHWPAAAFFFVALAGVQGIVAVLIAGVRSNAGPVLAAVVSAATVLLWIVSRTSGLPFGPEAGTPERVATGDLVSTASSLVVLAALVPLLRLPVPRTLRLEGALAGAMAVAAPVALALTVLAAAPSIREHDDGGHHPAPAGAATAVPAGATAATAAAEGAWPPAPAATSAPWSDADEVQALVERSYAKGAQATP